MTPDLPPPRLCRFGGPGKGRADVRRAVGPSLWLGRVTLVGLLGAGACLHRPVDNPNIIVVGITNGPNNLDPRFGIDDSSAKIHQLLFDTLLMLDDRLRVVADGGLAERFENPTPTTYVVTLRRGVRFQDGHELTSADVVYTFRTILDPELRSPRRGAFRGLKNVDAPDRDTAVFSLDEPFPSFPINLVAIPIIPDGAPPSFRDKPVGTGPYRFVRYAVDDRVELAPFADYWQGAPRNEGLVLRIVPDEVMRGLELRKGAMDVVVNDVSPDIFYQLQRDSHLQTATGPGVDYQYIGLNLRDPILRDVRVRQALAHAIDRRAIVEYLRRGLATPANGMLPPLSWAYEPDLLSYDHDPARARALLDAAGYPDPDGDGPAPRLRLSLKVSNVEFNRLQSTVIQQDLAQAGIALDVRTYEFATLFADIIGGNFQLFTLQWPGGALADPDILRRVFHSSQTPPAGFNRGHFHNPEVDRLLDEAATATDPAVRRQLVADVQRMIAREVPYISLWHKTNFVIAQRSLTGIHLSPTADFYFLRDVARTTSARAH
jgi:peptide/nickel transport system substrate-binding protein